jgi:dTMP kinase
MFITLEGIDNTGKTEQTLLLKKHIGDKAIRTREPGGCPISEKIREALVQGTSETMDGTTELLLMNAQRREHIKQTIKPTLDEGNVIVCDRYIDSTLAYQGAAIDEPTILGFHKQLCFNLFPDIVFLIDLDPMISYQRETNKEESRFESKGLIYMISVRDRFLERAEKNPDTHIIINGEMSIEEIHKEICKEYDDRISNR